MSSKPGTCVGFNAFSNIRAGIPYLAFGSQEFCVEVPRGLVIYVYKCRGMQIRMCVEGRRKE